MQWMMVSVEKEARGKRRRSGSAFFRMEMTFLNFSLGLTAQPRDFFRLIFILILYVLVSRASLLSCDGAQMSQLILTGGAGKAPEKFLWFVFGPMSLALRFFV